MVAFCQTVTSFNRHHAFEMSKIAAMNSFPGIAMLLALFQLFSTIHPQLLHSDNLRDPDAEDIILTTEPSNLEQAADLYLQRKVTIETPSQELRLSTQKDIKTKAIDTWRQRIVLIDRIAKDFGIKKVAYGLSIPIDSSSTVSKEYPYASVGNKSYHLSDPVIIRTPPSLRLEASKAKTLEADRQKQQKPLQQMEEFLIAHEIIHIAKNHSLISSITYVAFAILNTAMWVVGLQSGISLASLACTYTVVLGTALLYHLFYYTQRRCQEREADIEAMNHLQSNEGAIFAMESFKNTVVDDLEHPPIKERLAYIQAHTFNSDI